MAEQPPRADPLPAVPPFPTGNPDLLHVAMEAVGEAILITGPDLDPPGPRIEYVNAGFTRLTGYTAAEVVGRTPRLLQGPDTDRAVLDRMRAAMEAGRPATGKSVNYRKDGTAFVVEWLITPVLGRDGRAAHWVSAQRDVTARKRAEARQKRLLDEVNHRVNNTLATVQSLAEQTLRSGPQAEEERETFLGRLFALSRVHGLLSGNYWAGACLRDLAVGRLAADHAANPGRLEAAGPELWLRPGAAVALGLALHELAANAAVHGALSAPGGRVRLGWSVGTAPDDARLRVRWAEHGGPAVPGPPARRGFGTRLIERALPRELRGEARLLFAPAGLRCEFDLPLDAVTGEAP